MENIDIDGTPFTVLMDRAVKIKSLQSAQLARKYNASPSFIQSSIFASDEVINARNLDSFTDRLGAAIAWKEDGNAAYRDGQFDEALEKYQMSLSLFRFVENTNPNIKNEGIKDEYLKEIIYIPKSNDEQLQMEQLLVKLYNNIALTSLKRNDHRTAVQACDCALEVDCENDKAFYLRAQARLAPKNASATDEELVMMDLRSAVTFNPNNTQARKQLKELRLRVKSQRTKDKDAFSGLFNRGEVYDANELDKEKEIRRKCRENDRVKARCQDVVIGRQLVQLYDERGMIEEKTKIEESLKSLDVASEQVVNDFDFRNPTAKMVEDARAIGVDLYDQQTIEMLEQMREDEDRRIQVCNGTTEQTSTGSITATNKYSSRRIFKIFRGVTMLFVLLIVYIRILTSFIHSQMNA